MTAILWMNLSLGVLFVLAIVGIPLWMTIKRPDTAPDFAQAQAYLAAKAAQGGTAASPSAAVWREEIRMPARAVSAIAPARRGGTVASARREPVLAGSQ